MDVKLVVVGGKHAGTQIPVAGPSFLIGRAEQCQLRPNSDQIAREHCQIDVEQGRALIRDLQSKTGTFINGERVTGERELRNGDRLRVGQLEFEVQLTVSVGGKKKPAVHSIREAAARMVEKSGGADLDVSEWLSQTESAEDAITSSEAQRIQARRMGKAGDEEKVPTRVDKKAGLFGQEAPKQTAADSRSAADDLLKKMLGQKKR